MRDLGVGDVLDGHRIEAVLARGGMASIFRALDEDSGEVVALKIPYLRYEADVVFYERFRREEEIALRLDHPNLVRALPSRREKTRVYLIMEYVGVAPRDRANLRERPRRRFDVRLAAAIVAILAALATVGGVGWLATSAASRRRPPARRTDPPAPRRARRGRRVPQGLPAPRRTGGRSTVHRNGAVRSTAVSSGSSRADAHRQRGARPWPRREP